MGRDILAYIDLDGYPIKTVYDQNVVDVPKVNQISEDGKFRFVSSRKQYFGIVYIWRIIEQKETKITTPQSQISTETAVTDTVATSIA